MTGFKDVCGRLLFTERGEKIDMVIISPSGTPLWEWAYTHIIDKVDHTVQYGEGAILFTFKKIDKYKLLSIVGMMPKTMKFFWVEERQRETQWEQHTLL